MATIKKKAHEKLDDANIARVITLLEGGMTKTKACAELNIAANTARLTKIIDDFKERKEREQRFRAANKGKPATPNEIQECIRGYLDGESLSDIANRLYRSSNFVKATVEKVGVPQRGVGDYIMPDILPEACVSESFEKGQLVWSVRYNALSIVEKEIPSDNEHKLYRIYVLELVEEPNLFNKMGYGGKYAVQAAYDLGSLEHLKEHGVDVYRPLRGQFKDLKNSS